MSLTLGLTGMDPATETALKAAFLEANARLGNRWSLVADGEAGHVVVDMDSMYGPMSWLRLHAAGRQVIGLTSAPRTQTDYRLGRPFEVDQIAALLVEIARDAGIELQATGAPPPGPADAPAPPAPATSAQADVAVEAPAPATTTAAPPAADSARDAPAAVAAKAAPPAAAEAPTLAPETVTAATPPAPAPAEARRDLGAWLAPGRLAGRVRHRAADGTTLLIDAGAESWHGPAALKSLVPCFGQHLSGDAFEPVDDAAWARESAAAGAAQPLARLRWLGGLLAGEGRLLPGYAADDRFQLNKWPQTEREYPRHFRIATQMMKGPATVDEIATASGVPAGDVADFINANLATGFAEVVVDAPVVVEEPARARGGLLGRLRSR